MLPFFLKQDSCVGNEAIQFPNVSNYSEFSPYSTSSSSVDSYNVQVVGRRVHGGKWYDISRLLSNNWCFT